MPSFEHGYPFDPSYGYTFESLLSVRPPREPEGFAQFWIERFDRARAVSACPVLTATGRVRNGYEIFDLAFRSTDGLLIGGWVLKPVGTDITRGLVVGHGYGGRDEPDFDVPVEGAVLMFPCFRGISRSRCSSIPENPLLHVVHGIEQPDRYVLGGCVDDLWVAVSALIALFPDVAADVGYLGTSFGGGVGALALPWDDRIRLAHLNVPTFGDQPLRLQLATVGSGAAIADRVARGRDVLGTLRMYDAATAATHAQVPVHVAAALFDPAVAPPGQLAVFNGLAGPKELFVLSAGHFDHPGRAAEERALLDSLGRFLEHGVRGDEP